MKVLIITPTPTHPTDQGNRVRVLQIGSAFKNTGAQVELLYYALDEHEGNSIAEMKNIWDALYVVKPDRNNFRRSMPDAWGVDDWVSTNLIEAVRFLSRTVKYDIVIVNYVWCSLLLDIFSSETVKIIDTHDAFGDRHKLIRETGMDPHWFYTSIEQEALGLNRADVVIAIQEQEGIYFRSITNAAVSVIEYAPIPNFLPRRVGEGVTFGYLGSGNPWNVRSIEVFDEIITDKIARVPYRERPNFLLFGGITKNITKIKTFQPIGPVANAHDAYSFIDIVLNPMIGGTGLKIKTVEALSFGLPVITTKSGGAGLEKLSSNIVCNSIDDMADKVFDFAFNPEKVAIFASELQVAYLNYFDLLQEKVKKMISSWQ